MDTNLIPIDIKTLVETEIEGFINGAVITKIDNDQQKQNVFSLVKEIKRYWSTVEEKRDSLVRPLNTQVDNWNNYFREPQNKLLKIEQNCKDVLQAWEREVKQKAIEDQRKADEAARKEKERIEADARRKREIEDAARREAEAKKAEAQRMINEAARKEKERIEADARRKREIEDAARREAERIASIKNAKARQEAEAKQAEAKRISDEAAKKENERIVAEKMENEKAQAKLLSEAKALEAKAENYNQQAQSKEAIASSVVSVCVGVPEKTKGLSIVKKYRGEINNAKEFLQYCLSSEQINFITIDTAAIDKVLQATKGAMKFPGITIIESEETRVRK